MFIIVAYKINGILAPQESRWLSWVVLEQKCLTMPFESLDFGTQLKLKLY